MTKKVEVRVVRHVGDEVEEETIEVEATSIKESEEGES